MSTRVAARNRALPVEPAESPRRPFHRPISRTWWLERTPYLLFVVRELTSVFVAGYGVFLIWALYRLGQGPAAYAALLETLGSPVSIVLHLVALVFVLFHSVTWFNLTPKIMVVRMGEEQVSPALVAGAVYFKWVVVSALLIWLVTRG